MDSEGKKEDYRFSYRGERKMTKQYKGDIIVGKSRGIRTFHANSEKECADLIFKRYGVEVTILSIKKCGEKNGNN